MRRTWIGMCLISLLGLGGCTAVTLTEAVAIVSGLAGVLSGNGVVETVTTIISILSPLLG